MDRRATSRVRVALNTLILLAGCLAGTAVAAATAGPVLAGTVPAAPSGWTTVFEDDFAGAAGSTPSSANWFYDMGTDSGNGEVNHNTNSTSNVYLDGQGHLVLKATDSGGSWTAAKIESTRDDFQAPPGGEMEMTASLEQPNPAKGLGYWPAFWALGSPTRTGSYSASYGETDMMEDVNGLNGAAQFLHTGAGTSSSHPLIPCPAAGSGCQTGYHTYSVIINRTNTSAEYLQFLMDGTVETTVTEAQVGTTVWQEAIDHGFFMILDLAIGGHYPNGLCGCTTPTSATTSGASMSVSYVAVYEKGGNSTPTATRTATGQVKGIDGLCMTNQNSLNTEINPMVATACTGSSGQQWSAYTDSTLRTEGGCLDVIGASGLDWYPCNGTAAETWTHESNGEFVNPHTGMCLTDPDGKTGVQLKIQTCAGLAQQIWTGPAQQNSTLASGTSGSCGTTNIALNQPTTASSEEGRSWPPSYATDGDTSTRWSSMYSDPQWLDVDLGSTRSICQVVLYWERAYAKAFQIQVSANNSTWTTIYSTTTGTGGTQTLNMSGSGRYIRMYGTARGTRYGYSLYEFQVHGS